MQALSPELVLAESCLRVQNLANSISAHLTEYGTDTLPISSSYSEFVEEFLKLRQIVRIIQDGISREGRVKGRLPHQVVEELVSRMNRTAQTLISADLTLVKTIVNGKKTGLRKIFDTKKTSLNGEMFRLSKSLSQDCAALKIGWLALSESLEETAPATLDDHQSGGGRQLSKMPPALGIGLTGSGHVFGEDRRMTNSQSLTQSSPSLPSTPRGHDDQGSPQGIPLNATRREAFVFASEEGIRQSEFSLDDDIPKHTLLEEPTSMYAVDKSKLSLELTGAGLDFRTKPIGFLPDGASLVTAVCRRDVKTLEYALKKGVSAEELDRLNLLSQAVKTQDRTSVQLLLSHGATVDCTDHTGVPILVLATTTSSADIIRLLLESGARPEFGITSAGQSPLVLAAKNGQKDIVDMLLNHMADINAIFGDGDTPLVACIHAGVSIDIINAILESGAAPDCKTRNGKTPLVEAITLERFDIVKALLDHGASPNLVGPKHPLWPATHHPPMLKLLISRGAKLQMATGTMELAVSTNNIESVQIFLSAGVSPNSRKDELYTPLCSAIRDNRDDILTLLLEHGADPNLPASEYPTWKCITHNRTHFLPLLVAKGADLHKPAGIIEEAIAHNNSSALAFLLERGVDVNAVNASGHSPLTTAIRENRLGFVQTLLAHGADVTMRGEDWPLTMAVGKPAILKCMLQKVTNLNRIPKGIMELAVRAGQLDSVKLLYKAGVNVEDKSGGVFSPLTSAVRENHMAIARFLLNEAGADVNESGEHLPLVKALRQNVDPKDTEMICLLLDAGADINLMYRGWSAVMQAIERGNSEILRLLIERGNGIDLQTIEPESGQKVIDIARERGWSEGLNILMEYQNQSRMITAG